MFESLVISFLKSYLGDYIDNLENITLGVIKNLSSDSIFTLKLDNEWRIRFKRLGNKAEKT